MPPKIKIIIENSNEIHEIEAKRNLSEVLDATNSSILFGCRTGICGTCLVKIVEGKENIDPPNKDEEEYLEIVADEDDLRLACQLCPKGNIKLNYRGN